MKPDISEFAYGYAITEELVAMHQAQVVGAPTFPSLYDEGKAGGGYDVMIPITGTPIFLQFKLTHCLITKNAKEYRSLSLKLPYYRMYLRPRKHSRQHQLLLSLEQSGQRVYYIAPEFHLPVELDRHYLARDVVSNSAAFRPSAIGALPDDDEHYVVFEKASSYGYRCSDEPKQVERAILATELDALHRQERKFGDEGMSRLVKGMLDVIRSRSIEVGLDAELGADAETIAENRRSREAAGYLARTYFASELIIVK